MFRIPNVGYIRAPQIYSFSVKVVYSFYLLCFFLYHF